MSCISLWIQSGCSDGIAMVGTNSLMYLRLGILGSVILLYDIVLHCTVLYSVICYSSKLYCRLKIAEFYTISLYIIYRCLRNPLLWLIYNKPIDTDASLYHGYIYSNDGFYKVIVNYTRYNFPIYSYVCLIIILQFEQYQAMLYYWLSGLVWWG